MLSALLSQRNNGAIMTKGIRHSLLTGLLFWAAYTTPALALDFQSPVTRANPNAARKAPPTKLTTEECTGAGGATQASRNCVSGSACYRADEFHVIHVVCISQK
jgi:hypothetical protein